MITVKSFLLLVIVTWLAYYVRKTLYFVAPIPNLPLDQYWGPGNDLRSSDTSIRNFKISFDTEMVKELKNKLKNSQFYTEPLEGVGFQYGFNNKYLKKVVDYWNTNYNFAERENFLNQYPQYKTKIQGLDIHFIHVKPQAKKNVRVLPLLLLHGWPGSVREFYSVIPLLTTPINGYDYVFELIIPSLPGYGYSQAASKPGMGPPQMAVVMKNLMDRLGIQKYYVQGGDWGSLIGFNMGVLFPDNVLGYHTNAAMSMTALSYIKLFIGSLFPSLVIDKKHEHKVYPIANSFDFAIFEGGYAHIQATKPDTVGVALRDSPVGLAAYILEKFSAWTDKKWIDLQDGGITKKYTLTDLLDNIMIYWTSGCITTSVRLYRESFNEEQNAMHTIPIKVPTAIALFEHELFFPLNWQLGDKYLNIVQKTEFASGGHFAAFEEPQLFASDIWLAVPKMEAFNKKN